MTFFDNFKEFEKDYTRERSTITKNSYGENVSGIVSSENFKGIVIKKGFSNHFVSSGKSDIPYIKSDAVLNIAMDVDVVKGDIVIDGSVRYRCGFVQSQDDFTEKNSHKAISLELIE